MIQVDVPLAAAMASAAAGAARVQLRAGTREEYLHAWLATNLFLMFGFSWIPVFFLVRYFGWETTHMWWTSPRVTDHPWVIPVLAGAALRLRERGLPSRCAPGARGSRRRQSRVLPRRAGGLARLDDRVLSPHAEARDSRHLADRALVLRGSRIRHGVGPHLHRVVRYVRRIARAPEPARSTRGTAATRTAPGCRHERDRARRRLGHRRHRAADRRHRHGGARVAGADARRSRHARAVPRPGP